MPSETISHRSIDQTFMFIKSNLYYKLTSETLVGLIHTVVGVSHSKLQL